jgi:16S rRNA (guanine527-N7)-methyltransferase
VASLPTLVELCAPLVRPGGFMAFPKSGSFETELDSAGPALKTLRSRVVRIEPVPEEMGLGTGRVTVVCQKVGATSRDFPRRVGLAKSQPIGGQDLRIRGSGSLREIE